MSRILASDAHLLPHDEQAELTVIGSILIDPDGLIKTEDVGLAASDFYDSRYASVYAAAIRVSNHRFPVQLDTISKELDTELDAIGGPAFLTRIVGDTDTAIHAAHYASIVKKDARRRRLMSAGAEVVAAANQDNGDLGELYDKVSQIMFGAMERSDQASHLYGGQKALDAYMDGQVKRQDRLARNPNAALKTYWADVDRLIGEFPPGQLVIIGAATSIGKTMAMEQISESNAKKGHTVGYYHLELTHQSMLDRCVCRCSGIDMRQLRDGYLGPEVCTALGEIGDWHKNITFIHCPGWSAERIAADIHRLHAQEKCELVVVDYLQKLQVSYKDGFNSAKLIGDQVEVLKIIAEQLEVPIILGSQVSRFYKTTVSKRPTKEDLRDSGEIEEKANIVMMLHNPVPREERRDYQKTEEIQLFVEKNTDGPLGMVPLVHVKGRFLLGDKTETEDIPY